MSVNKPISETSVVLSFSVLPDPRKVRNQSYSLFDIVTAAILAVLCGADDWVTVSLWAESNLDWLQQFGICYNGVPSHDTFSRFFRFVDPNAFEKCFISWTQSIAKVVGGVIALDGKTLCNSGGGQECAKAIHLVSAFSVQNDLVLGQLATEAKSNEITAFPLLIELLNIEGATVTIDAAGCQKGIAALIRAKGGDYVLALKGNQEKLHGEAENFFKQAVEVEPEEAGCDYYCSEEKSRGRMEKRKVWVTDDLEWLPQIRDWEGFSSLACVRSTRIIRGKESVELRYYISSLQGDAVRLANAIRSHWSIENKLHWQLDVSYPKFTTKMRKALI